MDQEIECTQLMEEVEGLETQIAESQAHFESLQAEIAPIEASYSGHLPAMNALQDQHEDANQQLMAAMQKKVKHQEAIRASAAQRDQLLQALATVKARVDVL